MKNVYILKNLKDYQCFDLYRAFKSLENDNNSFVIVVDHWFDIFYKFGSLLPKIRSIHERGINDLIRQGNPLYLDLDNLSQPFENILGVEIIDTQLPTANCDTSEELSKCLITLDNFVSDFAHFPFLLSDEHIQTVVTEIQKYVTVYTEIENKTTAELYDFVSDFDIVVCNNDFVFKCANELNIPCVIAITEETIPVNQTDRTFIFDPFRGEKIEGTNPLFTGDFKIQKEYNKTLIKYTDKHIEILINRIKKCIQKFGIPVNESVQVPSNKIIGE